MKKQHFVINHGTYPFDVLVCIALEHKEVVAIFEKKTGLKLKKDDQEALYMEGLGRTVMLEAGQTIIRLDKGPRFAGCLAHEIFHAVEFLFDRINLKHRLDSGEAFAYQIQHLTEQVYRQLKS